MSWLTSRRVLLLTVTALAASVLSTVPATTADAAPARPVDVLLPAPAVSPTQIAAGTVATVSGTRCVPDQSTRVFVSLNSAAGSVVVSSSVVPAADGTWTAHLTPPVGSAAGSYAVSATCDRYSSQASYRARAVTVSASTAAPWSAQTPALPNVPNGSVFDIDCVGAPAKRAVPYVSLCVAVGLRSVAGQSVPLVERYDGTAWTVDTIGLPAGSTGYLTGVDCPSTARCAAVGDVQTASGSQAFTALLAGTTWTSAVLPPPSGQHEGSLSDVSCPTAAVCFAVGTTGSLAEGSYVRATAYRLQGTTWTQIADPLAASQNFSLSALSCANIRTCVAVGNDTRVYPSTPIAQVYDGSLWHNSALIRVDPSQSPYLSDVSCPTTSNCVAVGSTVDGSGVGQPLVETLTVTTWRRTTVAVDPSVGGGLRAVSCYATNRCTAVGSTGAYQDVSPNRAVAAELDGGTWTAALADVPATEFTSVSCAGSCVAGGDDDQVPVVAYDTGTAWADGDAPAPPGYVGGEFAAVACSAANACTAGGWSSAADPNGPATPLVNRWNGTAWSIQTLPAVGGGRITGVACPALNRCVAVGRLEDPQDVTQPLVLVWAAGTWRRVTLRIPNGASGDLTAVSCTSATTCLAVGQSQRNAGTPIAVAITGVSARFTPTPPTGGLQYAALTGVSCLGDGSCRVVGYGSDDQFRQQGFDAVWTGSAFVPGAGGIGVPGPLSCVDAQTCLAVSSGYAAGDPSVWVLQGGQWRSEAIAYPASYGSSDLRGLSCRAGLACVAVGEGEGGAYVGRRSTTGVWTQQPVPARGTLRAVACPTDTRCVAVGDDRIPTVVVSPAG